MSSNKRNKLSLIHLFMGGFAKVCFGYIQVTTNAKRQTRMTKKITEIRETTDIISVDNLKDAVAKNNFVDLDQELIDQIQGQVDNVLQTNSQTEQTAREIIEKWFNKMLLKNRDFDVKNLRLTITNQPTVYIQSQYHCETRQLNRVYEPYSGQAIPDKVEDLWEKEPQNQFTESDIKWRRFGNNEVKNCHSCSATGQVTCGDCNGKGEIWVTCGNCKGKGQIERTDAIVGRGGGKMAGGVVLRKEQCLRCSAKGKVLITCGKCNGGGKLTCGSCSGRKELFYYDNIQGKTSIISKDLILSTFSNVKDKWIKNNKSAFAIQYKDDIHEQNESRLKDLIPVNGKLLLEKYNVKVLPTAKATFNFKGKDRELFIIDNEIFAHETDYLYDKKKTTIAIGITVIILVVLSFLAYNWYSNNQVAKHKEQNQSALNICNETKQNLSNGNFEVAGQKLASLELDNDFDEATKDSINSTIAEFLKMALNNKSTNGVNSVCMKFSNASFVNAENKKTLSDFNAILPATDLIQLVELSRKINSGNDYEKQKRFEEIAGNDVKIDSILNLQLNNQNVLACVSPDSISINTAKDFELYLSQLLSFEKTKEGMPCDIDDSLRKLEIFISRLKSASVIKLIEPTNKKLKIAQKKYENPC